MINKKIKYICLPEKSLLAEEKDFKNPIINMARNIRKIEKKILNSKQKLNIYK